MQTLKVVLTVLVVTVTALAAANPARAYNSAALAPEVHPLVVEELARRLMNQYARVPFQYWYPNDHATEVGLWKLIPEAVRNRGWFHTLTWLETRDLSHRYAVSHHPERALSLNNLIFEDAGINRARGARTMPPDEFLAAQRDLRVTPRGLLRTVGKHPWAFAEAFRRGALNATLGGIILESPVAIAMEVIQITEHDRCAFQDKCWELAGLNVLKSVGIVTLVVAAASPVFLTVGTLVPLGSGVMVGFTVASVVVYVAVNSHRILESWACPDFEEHPDFDAGCVSEGWVAAKDFGKRSLDWTQEAVEKGIGVVAPYAKDASDTVGRVLDATKRTAKDGLRIFKSDW